jgi:predicted RNA-binding protein with RPS1 domain
MHDSDANAPTNDRLVDERQTSVPAGAQVPDWAPPAEPAPETATHGGTAAVADAAAPAPAEPAAEATPAAEAEPAAVAEPAPVAPTEVEPVAAARAETEPTAQAESVAQADAVAQAEPPAQVEPVTHAPAETGAVPLAHTTPGPDAQPVSGPDQAVESVAPVDHGVAADLGATAQPSRPPKQGNEERRARAQAAWEHVVAAKESGEVLTGTVTSAVKGGLLVDVDGIRGFLPASQTRVPQGSAIESLVKTKVPLKVIDVDNDRRRIVVSQRRAMQEERGAKRRELLRELAVGQVREGTVVRLADFGAFVDLGGIDGLVPMRELAFERVEKVGDVLKVGEKLNVEVLRIEEGGKKISLSRKNALPDPWRDHAKLLQRGTTIEGKVISKERGLTVEIAPGVTGNVREDEINPDDYAIGETVEVSVRNVDRVRRRINLTTLHGAQATAIASAAPSSSSSGFAPLGAELLNPKPSNRGRRR